MVYIVFEMQNEYNGKKAILYAKNIIDLINNWQTKESNWQLIKDIKKYGPASFSYTFITYAQDIIEAKLICELYTVYEHYSYNKDTIYSMYAHYKSTQPDKSEARFKANIDESGKLIGFN